MEVKSKARLINYSENPEGEISCGRIDSIKKRNDN